MATASHTIYHASSGKSLAAGFSVSDNIRRQPMDKPPASNHCELKMDGSAGCSDVVDTSPTRPMMVDDVFMKVPRLEDAIGTRDEQEDEIVAKIQVAINHQNAISVGYASDDEASDYEEPQDSGRPRRSTRRTAANQSKSQSESVQTNNDASKVAKSTDVSKGRKRKKANLNGDGSDSDDASDGNDRSRARIAADLAVNSHEDLVCSCPKDVMKCIGILPSLPIINYFHDSDDTDSSLNDDISTTVLPPVTRKADTES